MSLRVRVVGLIALVLLLSMLMGTLVAGYEARASLAAELNAGLAGATQTVRTAFEDLPHSDHPERDLHQLTATFDGNRHVRAILLHADGRPALSSQTGEPASKTPEWFRALLGPSPQAVEIEVPRRVEAYRGIVLSPVAEIDVADAWREFLGIVLVLCGSAGAGLVLVYFVIGAAFRPLNSLSEEFTRIGTGDYTGRITERGPLELLGLQRGFNHMASQLEATTARNRKLTDQLFTIQEEERAEIARDLHDEFGPHLFAVNMDAETIPQLSRLGRQEAVIEQVKSIQSAVSHMQRQVRDLLGRLRPTRLTALGLNAAIKDLCRFWMTRRPAITFETELVASEDQLGEALKDVAYRIVQEAVNNAVRHGNPHTVSIKMAVEEDAWLKVCVVDDGAGGGSKSNSGGLGIVGMRERAIGAGGTLSCGEREDTAGWAVVSRIPIEPTRSLLPEVLV